MTKKLGMGTGRCPHCLGPLPFPKDPTHEAGCPLAPDTEESK